MATAFETFKSCFVMLCLIVSLSCVIWCLHNYILDLDLSVVSHKRFGEEENIIKPSMSLCFFDPFVKSKFEKNELGLNISYIEYKDFSFCKNMEQENLGN